MANPSRALDDLISRLAKYDLTRSAGKSFDMYHGSPHDFTKFDWSKLGSGEGHAAYGLGFYGAENPEIALRPSGYANRLTVQHVGERVMDEAGGERVDMQDWGDMRPVLYESSIRDPKQQEFLDALQEDDWLGYDDLRRVLNDLRRNPISNWDPGERLRNAHADLG
jgi:hypothetical protein